MYDNLLLKLLSSMHDTKCSARALHFQLYFKNPAKMLAVPAKLRHNLPELVNMIIHIK